MLIALELRDADAAELEPQVRSARRPVAPGGAIMHWHVDDLEATVERLLSMGAKEYLPVTKRGDSFITASVVDPFGNVLGVMYSQHYHDMLASGTAG